MLTVKNLPLDYIPRPYQQNLLYEFFKPNPKRRAYLVWSRRMGKDVSCWAVLILKAFERRGNYFVIFPTARQGRKAIWLGIHGDGVSFLDHIPERLIEKVNNTEMRIHLINKSVIQIIGAANYNYAMGTNPVGIIYSEYALQTPHCYTYLYPIVVENKGWLIINTTPRAHNHAYRLYHQVLDNKEWYVSFETVATCTYEDGKMIIKPSEIIDAKKSGMSDQLIKQEFFCDWESAIENAYFAHDIALARKNNRIKLFPIPAEMQLWSFWDLGVADLNTIWIVGFTQENILLVDYYQNSRHGLKHYVDWILRYQEKHNVLFNSHFAPHDMAVQSYSTGKTRVTQAHELGLKFKVCPKPKNKMNSIEVARGIFTLFIFHSTRTQQGMDALMHYHAKSNPEGGEMGPVHDWSSHGADSFLLIAETYARGMLPLKKQQQGSGLFQYNEGLLELI